MADYFATIAAQLGINILLLVVILVWSLAWKLVALWKSARNKHLIWFIVLAVFNTIGILPILYIFVFSKRGKKSKPVLKKRKRKVIK